MQVSRLRELYDDVGESIRASAGDTERVAQLLSLQERYASQLNEAHAAALATRKQQQDIEDAQAAALVDEITAMRELASLAKERRATVDAAMDAGFNSRNPQDAPTGRSLQERENVEAAQAEALYNTYVQIGQELAAHVGTAEEKAALVERENVAGRAAMEADARLTATTRERMAARKQEAAGLHDANVIMQQLGSKTAQQALVTERVAKNARDFAEAMRRVALEGKTSTADMERMNHE